MRESERERRKFGELRREVFALDLGNISIQVLLGCFTFACSTHLAAPPLSRLMIRSANLNADPEMRNTRIDERIAASLCLFLGRTIVSNLDGDGNLFFRDDGARLRAYSWRSLYSFGVSEMRKASRAIGWVFGVEDGSDGAPAAAPAAGMVKIWLE